MLSCEPLQLAKNGLQIWIDLGFDHLRQLFHFSNVIYKTVNLLKHILKLHLLRLAVEPFRGAVRQPLEFPAAVGHAPGSSEKRPSLVIGHSRNLAYFLTFRDKIGQARRSFFGHTRK